MLILVGVTINVALNGGLFQKAKTAADKTQREADKEELLSAIYGTADNNGNLNIASLTINGWTKSAVKQDTDNKTYYEFTSAKENVFYVYDETGKILDTEPTQNANTEAVSEQVQGLAVGDILKYNNENWVVLYNDNTNGFQIVKAQGITYTGTITTSKNNQYDVDTAKSEYNGITKKLSNFCETQTTKLQGVIGVRCLGSPANYYNYFKVDINETKVGVRDADLDNINDVSTDDLYTYSGLISTSDKLKKATNPTDMEVITPYMSKFTPATDSRVYLLANRSVHVSSNADSILFYTSGYDLDNGSTGLQYYIVGATLSNPAEVTAADNYTVFPVILLDTGNGFTVTETETVGTFTYSYSE